LTGWEKDMAGPKHHPSTDGLGENRPNMDEACYCLIGTNPPTLNSPPRGFLTFYQTVTYAGFGSQMRW
jgi:hypothetical protein